MNRRIELRIPSIAEDAGGVHLVEWLAEEGDTIRKGQAVFAIESDKSVIEVPSPGAGTLNIVGKAGEIFPVGFVVGTLTS